MVVRSPHPDIAIPDVPLPEFVLERALALGDAPALIDGPTGRTLSYRELGAGVDALAAGLAERGLRKGEVFAIFAPNVPEFALAFHGVAAAGGVNTTVNALYTVDEVAAQLSDSGARFMLTAPPLLDRAREAADRAGIEELYVLGEGDGATSFATLLAGGGQGRREVEIRPGEDLVALPYSSGTTGLPKGVELTHRNLVANLCQMASIHRLRQGTRIVAVLPFFHIYGQTVIMNLALRAGATIVTMPRFELDGFLELLERHRAVRVHVAPPMVLALAKHPLVEGRDLSALEQVMSGAAPLGAELEQAAARRIGCPVVQGFGLTESSPVTHATPDDDGPARPGSVGPPVPNTEVRIVDHETGKDLPAGETGELWVRGPQVMRGYLGNPVATADTIVDGGWLRTGDLVRADEQGYLWVVDRLKELIKYKGYQVPPAQLEALLLEHPDVSDAAVVRSPDPEAGEVPKAYVVAGGAATAEELMAFVAERVAPFKRVRLLEFVDEIPKSPSGKVLRRRLIESDPGASQK